MQRAFCLINTQRNASHVNVYGMCGTYDNPNVALTQSILFDGNFHQLCLTYETNSRQVCVYLDLFSPTCFTRLPSPYNTGLGDVRVGWWSDGIWQFQSIGGGLIRSVSLFDIAINRTCVNYVYNNNFAR